MKALKLYWIDMKERHLEENQKEILYWYKKVIESNGEILR